jgi:hypothetical protein
MSPRKSSNYRAEKRRLELQLRQAETAFASATANMQLSYYCCDWEEVFFK